MIEYKEASVKDIIKYKVKCLINTIWKFYNKYVELYDFGDLF